MTPPRSSLPGVRLRRREQLLGLLLPVPNLMLVELAARQGFDMVVLDTEHGPADQLALVPHLAVATAGGIDVLVRVGAASEIPRVLDLGAAGVVVPHVASAIDASTAVAAAHYPPLGSRSFATYTPAAGYGSITAADHHARQEETVVIAMIEDLKGVRAADDIAATPGITGLLVGSASLASAAGTPGDVQGPGIRGRTDEVHAATRRAGRAVVSIVGDRRAAQARLASGDDLVLVDATAVVGTALGELASLERLAPRTSLGGSEPGRPSDDPVVLVPGMLGDGDVWAEAAALLADRRSVQVARIDLDDSVPEAAATILASAPPTFALAGHSLGGIVALEIVRQAPERVTRLALLNTSARAGSDAQQAAWAGLRRRVEDGDFPAVAAEMARANLPERRRKDAALVARLERSAAAVGADGLLRQLVAQGTRPDSRPSLAAIRVPTAVVTGGDDQVCPPELQEELATGIPGAVHRTLDGVGHMAPIEAPAAVAEVLVSWLQ